MSNFQRAALGVIAAGLFASQPSAALADTAQAEAFGQTVTGQANVMLKQFVAEQKQRQAQMPQAHPQALNETDPNVPHTDATLVAQERPVGQREAPIHSPRLPPGWNYTLDISSAWAAGKTGAPAAFGLVGGIDAVLAYGFSRYQRITSGYYELQEYPIGFNTGVVPVYLQGVATPIATQNLGAPPGPINASVKNKLSVTSFQNMFLIGMGGKKLPIIVSPTYTSRWGTIGGGSDLLPIEIDGFPYTVHFRTASYMALAFTVPFLASPKFFGTYTIAPQWVTGLNGANQTNKAQLIHLVYTEFNPTKKLTIFFEPSLFPNYLPTDQSPQHYATFVYGAAYKPSKRTFVQGVWSMGGAMNRNQYGITSLTCQQLPCTSASQVVPALGGNHAAQFQLKVGIGSPTVIPL